MGHEAPSNTKARRGEISILVLFLMILGMFLSYFFVAYKTDEELLTTCHDVAKREGGRLTGVKRGIVGHTCEWQ